MVCLIDVLKILLAGDTLSKFNEHSGEVTAIDFDGLHLAIGATDGTVVIYSLSFDNPKQFGTHLHKFTHLHNKRSVSGLKIFRRLNNSSQSSDEVISVVTCGFDKKLICTEYVSGKLCYEVLLPSIPLCMDYQVFLISCKLCLLY